MQFEVIEATDTVFKYGYFGSGGYFVGVEVRGSGMTYDPDGNAFWPISGTVKWIAETTESSDRPEHIKLTNLPVTDVAELNATGINWFGEAAAMWLLDGLGEMRTTLGPQSDMFDTYGMAYALNASAGDGNDIIIGTTFDDVIRGGSGQDILAGRDGNDTLSGGGDDDELGGETGNDSLYGGSGNDTMYGGADDDFLRGDSGNDVIWGDDLDERTTGGNDVLRGGTGNDILIGAGGDDELRGEDDDDVLVGDQGADTLKGGDGNDTLWGGYGESSPDIDTGNDKLFGGNGDDLLFGQAGNDKMLGDAGNDILVGGDGNDDMRGGDGFDALYADGGRDTLTGGADADQFLFVDEAAGQGVVKDFAQGEDVIGIQYALGTTAEEQYDLFVANAVQHRMHTFWTSESGEYRIKLLNTDLDQLSSADFTAVDGWAVLSG